MIQKTMTGVGVIALAFVATACAGQSEFLDDGDWTAPNEPVGSAWREAMSLGEAGPSGNEQGIGKHVLPGVRHDLTMKADAKPTQRCSCLDVVVGDPRDRRLFNWAGAVPTLSPHNILIALKTEGSQCSVSGRLRPSIQAVDTTKSGAVVVVIEELVDQRPQALGAIIPRPRPGQPLYVRSRRSRKVKLPFANSLKAHGMCEVALAGVGTTRDAR